MKVSTFIYPRASKVLRNAQIRAIGRTAEQMLAEIVTEEKIPLDTGALQNVGTFVDTTTLAKGEIKIVHDTPYAAKLYFHPEYNFDTTLNRNAQGLWWDAWINGSKNKRAVKIYKMFYKMLTGGYVK